VEVVTDEEAVEALAVADGVEALDAAARQVAFWPAQKAKLAPGVVTHALFWASQSLPVEVVTDEEAVEALAVADGVEALDAAARQVAFWPAQKAKLAPGAVTQALFWAMQSLAVEVVALARQDACWAPQ
jgi:hypothetical protein